MYIHMCKFFQLKGGLSHVRYVSSESYLQLSFAIVRPFEHRNDQNDPILSEVGFHHFACKP